MHERAHEIVRHLAGLPDGDDEGEILCDGIICYLGTKRIHRETVLELLRATAITESWSAGTSIYYALTGTGRSIARRPELADEVFATIMRQQGGFTIVNDRIVSLAEPTQ